MSQYKARIHKSGALIPETFLLVKEYCRLKSLDALRRRVLEDNILDKGSQKYRKDIWTEIRVRCFLGQDEGFEYTSLLKVIDASLSEEIERQALFYHVCLSDALVYDLTAFHLFETFQSGAEIVSKTDVESYLQALESEHPELKTWSLSTRNKTIRYYLATMKDFGILEGRYKKRFCYRYLPIETFTYVVYYLQQRDNHSVQKLINHSDWRLFFLEPRHVEEQLFRAQQEGFLKFESAGSVIRLDLNYRDTGEYVDALIAEYRRAN